MHELEPLIQQAEREPYSHVIVMMHPDGVRWRAQTEAACNCMRDVLEDGKVMPREEFIAGLKQIVAEDQCP